METKLNETNLFSDFIKIFTGLLIGLASFQILVPLIWNYLSELLHLEKYTSYCVIIIFYFILPCLLLLIWWFSNKHKLKGLLSIHPKRTDELNYIPIVRLLNIFFPAFFIINFLLFLFSFLFDNVILFYSLQAVATIVCLYVFVRVVNSVIENLKKEQVKKKRKYYGLIGFVSALFFLFVVFEVIYLTHKDKTKSGDITTFNRLKIANKAEIYNAFRLNELKEALINTRRKFEFNLERVQQMQQLGAFDSTLRFDTASLKAKGVFDIIENKELAGSILGKAAHENSSPDSSVNFKRTNESLVALSYLIDRVSDSIVKQNPSVILSAPPYHLDNLLGYVKISTIHHEDSLSLAGKETGYTDLISSLQMLEDNAVKLCKRQLTIVLNNNQMKGIFLFSITLFIMLTFYLLLKTNEDVFTQLASDKENEGNKMIISKSELNKGMLSDVWIILNILVWLLIPLFKPVTEDSIMIDKPLQSMTFNRYLPSEKIPAYKPPATTITNENPFIINAYSTPAPVSLSSMDTALFAGSLRKILEKLDNLELSGYPYSSSSGDSGKYDDSGIKEMLVKIQERVNTINSSDQEANVIYKLYRKMEERNQRANVNANDKSFKPDKNIK